MAKRIKPVTQRGERERVSYEGEGKVGRKWKMTSKRMKKTITRCSPCLELTPTKRIIIYTYAMCSRVSDSLLM